MELWIRLRRRQPILREQVRIVEIDWPVEHAARGIDVNDFDVLADRPLAEIVFPRYFDDDFVDHRGLEAGCETWIERQDAEPALRGLVYHRDPSLQLARRCAEAKKRSGQW
jgi:hypothetical protein